MVATAHKRGAAPPEVLSAAVDAMTTLNAAASEAALRAGAVAATDVTGFGLLGHLHRMLRASGTAAEVWADQVPLLPGAAGLAAAGFISGGTNANVSYLTDVTDIDPDTDPVTAVLLHDAQTSGGLLIAVRPDAVDGLRGRPGDGRRGGRGGRHRSQSGDTAAGSWSAPHRPGDGNRHSVASLTAETRTCGARTEPPGLIRNKDRHLPARQAGGRDSPRFGRGPVAV